MIKYSFILSTLGTRETLSDVLHSVDWFLSKRKDTELVICTTNPNLHSNIGRIHYFTNPGNTHDGKYYMWRHASDLATGEYVVKMDDDIKFSKNFLDNCDRFFDAGKVLVQPTLVDAEGYILLSHYISSYTISAFRREFVKLFDLGFHRYSDANLVDNLVREYGGKSVFDHDSYCLHYGYPVPGGVDSTQIKYRENLTQFRDWVEDCRRKNNFKRVDLTRYFVIDSTRLTKYDEDGNWNLAKTFDGSFGTWNPPSSSEKISQLENHISQLQNHIDQLENSLSLRIGRKIPLGRQIRKMLYPNDEQNREGS